MGKYLFGGGLRPIQLMPQRKLDTVTNFPEIPGETLLHKYRSFATDEQIAFAKDILLNHRLYCAASKSFYDPFEFGTPFSFRATEKEKIKTAVGRILKEDPNLGHKEALKQAPSRIQTLEAYGENQVRAWAEDELGVVSLAENLDNLLLWAHYASGHTGICIQFRASGLSHAEFFGNAFAVQYQKNLPVIEYYRDNPFDKVKKLLATKSVDWRYEREWRIIVQDRRSTPYLTFDPKLITAVYLGCKITAKHRAMVEQWLATRSCPSRPSLCQAECSATKYRLIFKSFP